MADEFTGKIVLITGGGRGIGADIAAAFARRGAHVIVNYFHSEGLAQATLAEIVAAGGSAELLRGSVGQPGSVRSMFEAIGAAHGGLDVLVNNAGYGVLGGLAELSDEDWQRGLDVNLHGVRWCVESAVPLLQARGGGAIVNLSSIGAEFVTADYAAMGASRAAQETLTRFLAADLGRAGIRVNVVSASLVDNYAMDYWADGDERRRFATAGTPLGVLPSGADVAEAIVFLASDSAGSITGQRLLIDGGMSLHLKGLPVDEGPPAWTRNGASAARVLPPASPGPVAEAESATSDQAIAVVGMGLVLPGANSPEEFWQVLGRQHHTFGEPDRYNMDAWYSADLDAEDKSYLRTAGFARDFRPHPSLAAELADGRWRGHDETSVFLRHCLLQARETVTEVDGDRYGCYLAAWSGGGLALEESILSLVATRNGVPRDEVARHYRNAARRPRTALPDLVVRNAFAGLLPADTDWLAPDAACSSSLYSIDLGVKSLLAGDCDIAFCGGGNIGARRDFVLFAKNRALSDSGELRAFDAGADGVLFSDGAAVVALKRLRRATADGDEILGVLSGFGGATDGQGSVVATDVVGQRLAIQRARAVNGIEPATVDWIIAHGTGTPVGDLVELRTMAELSGADGHLCTSNKPLVGHSGWAAGTVSVIHALLALRHSLIPGERYFTSLPSDAPAGSVTVPIADTPWPATTAKPRTVGISGFGLGGTNGHLLIQDRSEKPSDPAALDDEMVLVGWAAQLPDAPDAEHIRRWLRTGEGGPGRSFGEQYPLPPVRELRMPPVTARSIDRTQLMALAVATRFAAEHGELWDRYRATTGVITASMGPSRAMMEYTIRTGATDLSQAFATESTTLGEYLAALRTRVPAVNEAALPGQLSNVVSARLANRLHLHGLTMALDCGDASTQAALQVAGRYLASGQLDLALVLGINGNSTDLMAEITEVPAERLAEGAVLLALTRRALAAEQGWPVLAGVRVGSSHTDRATPGTDCLRWGERDWEPDYLGANGAFALLRALVSGKSAVDIGSNDPGPRVTVRPEAAEDTLPSASPMSVRSVVLTRRSAVPPPGPSLNCLPHNGILLVDTAALARRLADRAERAGMTVLCTDPDAAGTPAVVVADPADPAALEPILAELDTAAPHVRLVASVRGASAAWPAAPAPALLRMQDVALLACKQLGDRLPTGSFAALLLDPLAGNDIHPHLTLFTGFARSLAREVACPVVAVVTDATLDAGLDQLAAEPAVPHDPAVVRYRTGVRYLEQTCPAPLPPVTTRTRFPLTDDAVVVATGGARGITAVALTALAQRIHPAIWLLGTTPEQPVPAELRDTPEAELPAARAAYLTDELRGGRGASVAELNRRFDELLRAREIAGTLAALRELCGSDRVRYLVCDVTDAAQTRQAAATIRAVHPRVDLLIHGAGKIRSTTVASKSLADFRAVRDPKVAGYHNLKQAFADPAPRLWCNFSSMSGLHGLPGDTDYSPANEYLAAAARYESRAHGTGEFTIGWGLWAQTGMVSAVVAHLARQYDVTGMSNAEGAARFLAELAAPRPPEPVSVYGVRAGRGGPRILHDPAAAPPRPAPDGGAVLLGRPDDRDADSGTWTWTAEPDRDRYLYEHLFDGRPVMPAVLMLAMAAEAAAQLAPTGVPIGFTDFQVEAPIYADPDGSARPCRIDARTVRPDTVRVCIRSDVTAPDGQLLRSDRVHCRLDVVVGQPRPPAPWQGRPGPRAIRLEDDTTMRPDIPVQLSGVWRTLYDLTVDDDGAHARWLPKAEPDGVFAQLPVPVLLLDSMLRLTTFEGPGRLRMAVPLAIGRVDLCATESDVDLALRYPGGLDLYYDTATEEFSAVDPAGRALVRLTGLRFHTIRTLPIPIRYPEWQPATALDRADSAPDLVRIPPPQISKSVSRQGRS